jgi:hypothetical protein
MRLMAAEPFDNSFRPVRGAEARSPHGVMTAGIKQGLRSLVAFNQPDAL